MRPAAMVGVDLLLVGVLEELRRDGPGADPLGGVVVPLVPQHADDLGGQDLVEHGDHPFAVGRVGVGDRALLDLGTRARWRIVSMSVRNSPAMVSSFRRRGRRDPRYPRGLS